MSVLISGALIDGAGVPMSECKIYLDALVNTSEVIIESFAVIETDAAGQYDFEVQKGKYTVFLKQKNGPKCCVGNIAVYDDSTPGTLNDFLTAPDEGDLKPDVVKRFEEMVAQAQQSAVAAAESEHRAGQHVTDTQKMKAECQVLAEQVAQQASSSTQNASRAEQAVSDVNKIVQKAVDKLDESATLAGEVKVSAARAEQAARDADQIVQKAVDKLDETATLTGEAKACAEAAAESEQNAKKYADSIEQSTEPEYYFVITLAGQSNAMSYGEGLPLPDSYDAPHPRIKQLARRSTVTPGGSPCEYNTLIPADHCLHDVQDMSGFNHPQADLSKGQYGCVGQGLHIAKKLLSYIPENAGILLVPCCRGGSAFTQGADGAFSDNSGATAASARWGVGKPLYRDLLSRTKAALDSNPKNILLAVCWLQGEFDMSSNTYSQQPELFTQMVKQFRSDLVSHLAQMPEFRVENVPWICGDTTYYWKDTYPVQYETVYGNYRNRESENIFFVPFMTDENGANTATNAPADDPDIVNIGYYGSASRTSQNWVSSNRPTHFSSWARRSIIPERLASAILLYAGRKNRLAASSLHTTGAPSVPGSSAGGGLNHYTPAVEEVGYNGRRGNGTLTSQGWQGIQGANVTVLDNTDGKGGHYLSIAKNGKKAWTLERTMLSGGDLIKYGGKLTCKFRIQGTITAGRYVFAFYWRIPTNEIPEGIKLADSDIAESNPFLMSFFVQTDAKDINLMHHRKTNTKIGSFGAFDNEWHTLELIYSGKNSVVVTPILDGNEGSPFSLANSPAVATENRLMLTDITGATTYALDVAAFTVQVYRDNGSIVLSDDDISSYVCFPPGYNGGKVVIPNTAISPGKTVQIVSEKAGNVTIEPASSDVLITPKDADEALPVSTVVDSSVTLVQIAAEGKTWLVT